jgi:multidrug efflux pump subunit AcrA (membrane-fusion protein)
MLSDEAIGTDQTQRFAFVVNDQHTVEYRKVTLGPLIDGLRVIRDGLKPEDWVVVDGVQRVRAGVQVDPQPRVIPQNHARLRPEAAVATP